VTNTLAYDRNGFIATVKSFISQAAEDKIFYRMFLCVGGFFQPNIIKLFSLVIYECSQ
jgi:hypothetical protein